MAKGKIPAPRRAGNTRARREADVVALLAKIEATDPAGFDECMRMLVNLVTIGDPAP